MTSIETATITDFLLTCIAEDERRSGGSRIVPTTEQIECPCGEKGFLTSWGTRLEITHQRAWVPPEIRAGSVMGDGHSATHTHIIEAAQVEAVRAAWPLAESAVRVLAECAAKRQIIECLRNAWDDSECTECNEPGYLADHLLRLLAAPYSARPGFREEWRP